MLHQFFHAEAALTYRPKQIRNAYQILTQLLDDPTKYEAHFTTCVFTSPSGILPDVLIVMSRFSASVVMAVTYGYDMNDGETFVTSMQRASDIVLRFGTPEISAVCAALPFSGCLPLDLIPLSCSNMDLQLRHCRGGFRE